MNDEEKQSEEKQIERRTDSFLRDILDNLDQYAFGIITQHGYRELEAMLNKHAEAIETKFHRWFVRGLVAFGIMALGVAAGLVGYGVLLSRQGDLTTTQGQLLQQIKSTRKSFVRDSCLAQNKRHDRTVKKLIHAERKAEAQTSSPRVRMKIRNSVEVSIGLIDSLAPVQDCNKLAAVSIGEAKPPPPDIHTPTKAGGNP